MKPELFERVTPLTDIEKDLADEMVSIIETYAIGHGNAITNRKLTVMLNRFCPKGYTLSSSRVRKMINHIRVNNKISNLLACSHGYFVSASEEEERCYIKSLINRHLAIVDVEKAMALQAGLELEEIYRECGCSAAQEYAKMIGQKLKKQREEYIKKGGKIGRRKGSGKSVKQFAQQYKDAIKELKKGTSISDIAVKCKISVSTIYRLKKKLNINYKVKCNEEKQIQSK